MRWKAHNIALKYCRQMCEKQGLDRYPFNNDSPFFVAEIDHPKGTEFWFKEDGPKTP